MDLFAKAVKNGIAKGYAVGQQQLQQQLNKQRTSAGQPGQDGSGGYYSAQQQNTAPTTAYNTAAQPPPLPPRQYQVYQASPAPVSQDGDYYSQVNHDGSSNSQSGYSYSSILPPPPPSYVPPQAGGQPATPTQTYVPQQFQHQNENAHYANNSHSSSIIGNTYSLPNNASTGYQPVPSTAAATPLTPTTTVNATGQSREAWSNNFRNTAADHSIVNYDAKNDVYSLPSQPPDRQPRPYAHSFEPIPRIQHEPLPRVQYEPIARVQEAPLPRVQDAPLPRVQDAPLPRVQDAPLPRVQDAPLPRIYQELPPRGEQQNSYEHDFEPVPRVQQEPLPRPIHPNTMENIHHTAYNYRIPGQSPEPVSIEQHMSNLSLDPAASRSQPTAPPRMKKPINLTPVRADGPGSEVVTFCPEDRLVDYQLYWYHLEGLEDAPICTRCHADYIEPTSLASRFTRKMAAPDSVSSCNFRYAQVKEHLWKIAVQTANLDDLKAFLSRRLQIPNCKGRTQTTGSDGIKYYGMKQNDIDGFIACEACYEDNIASTPFESRFEVSKDTQGDNKWICDMSIQYVRKAVAQMSQRNDWFSFVDGASRRFKLRACTGESVARVDTGNWYTTRHKLEGFQVCHACYMDKVELDVFAHEFIQIPEHADFDEYVAFLRQFWTCSLTSSSLPMMFALDAAENTYDFGLFHKAAGAIIKLVPCTANGILRGNWWTLTGGCSNFDICEACYEGIMKTNALDKFLEAKEPPGPEETIVCDFCPAAPRYSEYLSKFAETLDRGIFSCYDTYVRTFAAVPQCPRREHLEKGTWWGYDEALFCQNCYLVFVKDTSLSAHMLHQGAYDERAQICQIWSPRMRTMWLEACDAGAPGSPESDAAVTRFREFGAKRLQVYLVTLPQIKFIRGMQDIKMMQAMQQGQLSLMYQGMNSMSAISGATDGYMHGNSSLGWYETENGATAAQMFNNMQSGMANANRPDEWMQIFRLELQWQEVE
ncbi:hypothetical protein NQ176_g3392 [Zarea fungicola]|uniref:Uncharacterized protein n=1 Tax=Zarea fungicola TaxID=93591 RepID=A0ACC1NK16_9HYPO|nr:hypothetical protein NQ176_g3392 [Lecanicillium fungicola]